MTGIPFHRALPMGLLLLWLSSTVLASEPPSTTLAAFDIGSGTTRMLVADVALCSGDILHVRDSAQIRIPYASDLDQSDAGEFSPALQERADAIMAELIERADRHQPERKLGVATQAFRMAGNATSIMERWQKAFQLELRVLDQEQEARLAWRLVAARTGQPRQLLVWDIGAGSQQMVWQDRTPPRWHHINTDLASVTLRNRAIELLERPRGITSPNPLSRTESEQLSELIRDWLPPDQVAAVAEQIDRGARVIGIGGVHGISLPQQLGLVSGDWLERQAIAARLEQQLGRSDEDIGGAYADTEVINLILVGTLMDLFGMARYQAMAIDLTEALLLESVAGCEHRHE